jgi:membrane-bound lytic murein transglycosylase MltF
VQCRFGAVLCAAVIAAACGTAPDNTAQPQAAATAPAAAPSPTAAAQAADEELPQVKSPYDVLPDAVRQRLDDSFTGDGDKMIERRLIRAGVVFNRTQYFIDRGEQRGMVYESLRLFEEQLNTRLKTGKLPVHVAFVPLTRDQLFPALTAGKVDLVAAALTVTPERAKLVDFSLPTRIGVNEIVVTPAGSPAMTSADDLSGREVFVRRSSSYYESVVALNASLKSRGKAAVRIKEAPEPLEDDDLLEMTNAGLVSAIVMDDFVAEFWQKVFPNLQLHPQAAVRTDGTIAVATRKNSPILMRAINTWIKEYGPRTRFGNIVNTRYLENTSYAKSATSEAERKKFETLVGLFRKYGEQYNVDYLLMAAQGYQESQLDHQARSRVGAIGIMQVMPATGAELKVGDIRQLEPNIHAGIKYMRFMVDQYYGDQPMTELDKLLMTLASYNAGPGRVRQLRREAEKRGLNPNIWFGNVERIASERIGRETVQYVANIYKYYVAYRLALDQAEERRRLRKPTTQ